MINFHYFGFVIVVFLQFLLVVALILYHVPSAQSCPTLWDPMDCSSPASSVHGVSQARILQWVAISFFRGSSWSRAWTQVSCIAGGSFTVWTTIWAIIHVSMWIHVNINHDKCCEGRLWWSKSWSCRDGFEEGDGT